MCVDVLVNTNAVKNSIKALGRENDTGTVSTFSAAAVFGESERDRNIQKNTARKRQKPLQNLDSSMHHVAVVNGVDPFENILAADLVYS